MGDFGVGGCLTSFNVDHEPTKDQVLSSRMGFMFDINVGGDLDRNARMYYFSFWSPIEKGTECLSPVNERSTHNTPHHKCDSFF